MVQGQVGLQRTLKSWGYGVTEQGSQADLDPMAALVLLLLKQCEMLGYKMRVDEPGARDVASLSAQLCLSQQSREKGR